MDDKMKNSNKAEQSLTAKIIADANGGQVLSAENTSAENVEQILSPENTSANSNSAISNSENAIANSEESSNSNGEGSNSNGGGKKGKTHLSKNVKVAIGASITVVLLTLIIVIVVLAVQTMNSMTQMYYTNYSYVTDTVINNKFVAAKGNEYVLMEGDKEIAGGFRYLRITTEYGGYYYIKDNGESGLLDFYGNEKVKFPNEEKFNLKKIIEFTKETVTVTDSNVYKTYKLSDFTEVIALRGINPIADNASNQWFDYVNGSYAIYNVQGVVLTVGLSDGTTLELNGSTSIDLIAAGEGKFLLSSGGRNYLVQSGVVTEVTDFVMQYFSDSWFYNINNALYGQQLKNLNIQSNGVLYAIGGHLQAGSSIYSSESGELTLFKENALLSNFKDEKFSYVSERILYDKNGKEVTRAESETGEFTYIGGGLVLEGTTLREVNSSKKIENVTNEVFGGNLKESGGRVFMLSNGSFATRDGALYTTEQQQTYGKVISDGEQYEIYKFKYGYVFVTEKGIFTPDGDRNFISLDSKEAFYPLGDKKNADNFAIKSYNGLTFYRVNRGLEEINRYYGENLKVKESFKSGLVVSIGDNAASSVCAIFAPNGNQLTSFNYSTYFGLEEMGDYILAVRTDGMRVLINLDGKEVITQINDYKVLKVYDYNGKFVENTKSAYAAIMDAKGYKVLKWNV